MVRNYTWLALSKGRLMKKEYRKPEIRKVKLVPSEAVLQACKNPSSGGPIITGCLGEVGPGCASIGS